jgi:hypothetical protein
MGSTESGTSGAGGNAARFDEPLQSGVRWWLEDRVLVVRTGEHFTTQDLTQAFMEAVQSTVFDGPLPVLFDNRHSAERATGQEIRARAERIGAHPQLFGPRIAVVVSDALHYGLARMGGSFAEPAGLDVQVFQTPDEAMAWLRDGRSTSLRAGSDAQPPRR